MEKAVSLAKSIQSANRYFFQSKLAGVYFYQNDFNKSKELSLDIIRNGRDSCYENMFYYYAARSFLKLGNVDSACWVESIIPRPVTPQDSFNHYLLKADLAKARNNHQDYGINSAAAEKIHRHIIENPTNSRLLISELEYDSTQHEADLRGHFNGQLFLIIGLFLAAVVLSICITARWMKGRIAQFQDELNQAKKEIEHLMASSEAQMTELLRERDNSKAKLKRVTRDLSRMTKKYNMLESRQEDIRNQAAAIVRERNAALKVLYQEIRFKMNSLSEEKTRSVTLLNLIYDFHGSKMAFDLEPQELFWTPLKSSVDKEFNGIATFVENNYPNLTARDHHLFWLLCANVSPQIIKLCMNYTTAVTVSNNKRRLIQEKIGMNVKFEDFINMYLNGEL